MTALRQVRPLYDTGIKVPLSQCGFMDRDSGAICGALPVYRIEWADGSRPCRSCPEHIAYLRSREDLSLVARIRDLP